MKIYLSYPMEFADTEISKARSIELRKQLTSLGYEVFNPYEANWMQYILDNHSCKNEQEFMSLKSTDIDKHLEIATEIRVADMDEVRFSDLVIAFLDRNARGGVPGELTLAAELQIPVYSIVDPKEMLEVSGWTLSCCDRFFSTIEECVNYVEKNPVI